jgi:DNA-binding response OmpR family regulator
VSQDAGRILLVDDERAVLDVLQEYFRGRGFVVEGASDRERALGAAGRTRACR